MQPSTLVVPAWVVPPSEAVWRCLAQATTGRRERHVGIVAVLEWIMGRRRLAPVSERTDLPVSAELALAESWIARDVAAGRPDNASAAVTELAGISFRPPVFSVGPEWCEGAADVLEWLVEGGAVPAR